MSSRRSRRERNAQVRWIQQWRRRNGGGSHHWPVVLPPKTGELPALGVVLAESLRGAA